MRGFLSSLAVVAGAVASVSAHTIFQQIYVNGVSPGHEIAIRDPTYDGPITDVTSDDMICNGGPDPLNTPTSTVIVNVPAGATVIHEWHHTLAGYDPSDSQDPIDPSHLGPIMVYLAPVSTALTSTVTGLGWFKIYEDGLDSGTWATTKMIANKGNVTVTIPTCIPNGNYLFRAEIIALHAASSYPGAQMYMECAQINITGGGDVVPEGYAIPGIYHSTDPGILIDIYYPTPTTYIIPGPTLFTCPGGGSPPPTSTSSVTTRTSTSSSTSTTTTSTSSGHTTTTTTTTSSTTSKTSTTTTSSKTSSSTTTTTSSSPSSSTSGAAHYGQCGGTGWTGPTTCAGGYTCTYSNPYYSQCL